MRLGAEVAAAFAAAQPVVALESTIFTHGLPRPGNLDVAVRLETAVRSAGAVPATVGLVAGEAVVGLSAAELAELATRLDVRKASTRDLAFAAATRAWAGTTVAATALLAVSAGIDVFATGGLGGVHRGARESWDESADLTALADAPLVVVCAGVKSVLDVGASLERLETYGVPVAGWRTDRFPAFYLADSGHPAPWSIDDAPTLAAAVRARRDLGLRGAIVVARPPDEPLDVATHDAALDEALAAAAADGVTGAALTPFLLERLDTATAGATSRANVALVVGNAILAAELAAAISADRTSPPS
jgi:pseudouridine-5'-phosphate glycosidase